MARTDLQRLFWRTATTQTTPLEDFVSEVLAIAIRYDRRPLLRALDGAVWKAETSGCPLDLEGVVAARSRTQVHLPRRYQPAIDAGRLDVVVDLQHASGGTGALWIEVKIDAPLTAHDGQRDQLDVYMDHRLYDPWPEAAIFTLAKTAPLREDVTGITWEHLVKAIDEQQDADRWWMDLAAFLRADGIVPHRLPNDGTDLGKFQPVYLAVNETIKELWLNPPRPLHWRAIEREVREGKRLFTSGPVTWGMRPQDDGWEWWVAIGNAGYPSVSVSVDDVREAARVGGLPTTWIPTDDHHGDRFEVFEKRRPLVAGEPATDASRWLSDALRELRDTGVLGPHFQELRRNDDLAVGRSALRSRQPSTPEQTVIREDPMKLQEIRHEPKETGSDGA